MAKNTSRDCPLDIFPAEKYDYWEISLWLRKCNSYILREDYNSQREYELEVYSFYEGWKRHYTKFESMYKSQSFKKAILAQLPMRQHEFYIKYYGGKVNITDNIIVENVMGSALGRELQKAVNKEINDYIKEVNKTFDSFDDPSYNIEKFKKQFRKLVTIIAHNNAITTLYFKKTALGEKIATPIQNYESAVKFFEKLSKKERDSFLDENGFLVGKKLSLKQSLNCFHIPDTQFYEYLKGYNQEYLFPKYIFVNLAFLLSLDENHMKKLLEIAGYSTNSKMREFDNIILNAFRFGLNQQYTNALINVHNERLKKSYSKIVLLPRLF